MMDPMSDHFIDDLNESDDADLETRADPYLTAPGGVDPT